MGWNGGYWPELILGLLVPGHAGVLVFGFMGVKNTPVVLMNGRAQ